jgi:hypothetical protein
VSLDKNRYVDRSKRTSSLKELKLQLQGDSMSRGDDSMNLKGFKGQTDLGTTQGLARSELKLQLLKLTKTQPGVVD